MVEQTTGGMGSNGDAGDGDSMIGRLLGGKYEIMALLGAGGFGAVYKAEQAPVGRIVAIKVIRANARDDSELRARFLREARSVARLKSPHIVTLYDYGDESDGLLYMVFEYVDGTPLDDLIKKRGPIEVQRALTLTIQVLEALSEAHEYGIVHRDLKPANIMISKGAWGVDVARVLDFGIAKVVGGTEDEHTVETRQGLIMGTPHYMAPEQVHAASVDGRTDLYAIGVLLYAMLKGHPPFMGSSAYEILESHVLKPAAEPLAELDAPAGLKAVIERAMAKKPAERFQSARAMAEALNAFLDTGVSQFLSPPSRSLRESEVLPKPAMPNAIGPDTVVDDPVSAPPTSARQMRGRWMLLTAVLLAGALVGAYLGLTPDTPPVPPTPPTDRPVTVRIGQTLDQGVPVDAALAIVDAAPARVDAKAPVERVVAPQCRVNADCSGKQVCRAGKCTRARPPARRCRAEKDCPPSHFCEKGKCRKIKTFEF